MTADSLADKLREVRQGLLRLHKALLDSERVRYEREHGRVEDGLRLLNLVANDPLFAWLRQLSALIVQIDERLDSEEPLTAADAKALRDEARGLLAPGDSGAEFHRNYSRTLQENPDVVMMHAAVIKLLTA